MGPSQLLGSGSPYQVVTDGVRGNGQEIQITTSMNGAGDKSTQIRQLIDSVKKAGIVSVKHVQVVA